MYDQYDLLAGNIIGIIIWLQIETVLEIGTVTEKDYFVRTNGLDFYGEVDVKWEIFFSWTLTRIF